MQTKSLVLTEVDQLDHRLWELAEFQPDLLMVFASPSQLTDDKIYTSLKNVSPNLVGCSTAGEINDKQVLINHVVISAIKFSSNSHVVVHTQTLNTVEESYSCGAKLGAQIHQDDLKAVYIIAPGIISNGSSIIEGLTSALPTHVGISGGLAGDADNFVKTHVLSPSGFHPNQVVAVGFYGNNLQFRYGAFGGWRSFGPARSVSKSKENILFQLDDKPALETYKHYLGDYASTLPSSGLHFPFEILGPKRKATGLIRTILNVDEKDGSLVLGGEVLDEQYVRLMHASTDDLIDGASIAIQNATAGEDFSAMDTDSEFLGLVVSCVGRRLVMGDRVQEEIEELHCHFPANTKLAGYYSYGELSPFDNHSLCQLHNQTLSVTLLWEADH
ncbi:FIST N-terminal domain-containing protein [Alteromonas sp. D210916BOD_24]|uniref:FIST signal transduction protein n=1 Tax=Alteromonas sp. D210916BOD_24 TaxID=3157618 RepID=UPI00399C7B91